MNLDSLKAAVADRPDLLETVIELEEQRYRLAKLILDLRNLDEALSQRALLIEDLKNDQQNLSVRELVEKYQQVLIGISSFINMASAPPEKESIDPTVIFSDLMKRM